MTLLPRILKMIWKNSLPIATFTVIIFIVTVLQTSVHAQTAGKHIREGNELYADKKYSDAEIQYRKSLEKTKESVEGNFNLGDALYKQGKFEEAAEQFKQITSMKTDKDKLSKAYHNLGNSYLKAKKYEESIESYKGALKQAPNDEETKYNLAYAKAMLQQQQKQQQQNKDNKDKKDDKKKDDKNKDEKEGKDEKEKNDKDKRKEEKESKDKKDQEAKDGEGDKENKDPSKSKQQNKISKEDAQRMLDALNNQEKEVQKKLQKKEGVRVEIEKNW